MRKLSLLPIALFVLAGQAAAQKEIPPAAPFKRTVWVAPQGFVRLFQLTGSLRVLGWDRDSLAISGTMHVPEQGEFTVTPGKQGVRVSLWGPAELRAKPSDLTIYVPRASQLWIKTQSAAVTVQDFEGRLDIETVSGNVAVNGRPRKQGAEDCGVGEENISRASSCGRHPKEHIEFRVAGLEEWMRPRLIYRLFRQHVYRFVVRSHCVMR